MEYTRAPSEAFEAVIIAAPGRSVHVCAVPHAQRARRGGCRAGRMSPRDRGTSKSFSGEEGDECAGMAAGDRAQHGLQRDARFCLERMQQTEFNEVMQKELCWSGRQALIRGSIAQRCVKCSNPGARRDRRRIPWVKSFIVGTAGRNITTRIPTMSPNEQVGTVNTAWRHPAPAPPPPARCHAAIQESGWPDLVFRTPSRQDSPPGLDGDSQPTEDSGVSGPPRRVRNMSGSGMRKSSCPHPAIC